MIGWLFWKAHSATSIICFFVAITVVVLVGMRSINKNFIGTYMLAATSVDRRSRAGLWYIRTVF